MTLNGVMAVTLRYFTEFGKPALQKTICGGIYARVYCIFSACTMSSQKKFTFAISSPDEFLVLTRSQLMKLISCWSSIYKNMFGYFKWESVKDIQTFCQTLNVARVVHKLSLIFLNKLGTACKNNSVLSECCSACVGDVVHSSLIFQNF